VNDYEEIQKLYEGTFLGQHVQMQNYGPNLKWRPGEAPPGYTLSNGPGRLPLASPDSGKQRPADAIPGAGQGFVTPIDEEAHIEPAEVINLDVLEQLDELRDECVAERGEEDYSVLQLSRLRDRIISLSQ
jgi:hypothetical protein